MYKKRLNKAVDIAISTDYRIHDRAVQVRNALYAHKNVCIFGTGEFFEDCATQEHLTRFEYVSDNNPACWGKEFKGRKCLSPQELSEMDDVGVLIMIGEWRPVYAQLRALGIDCWPMDWYTMNVYDPKYSPEWFENNREKIVNTVDLFADELSKEIYVEAVCNRIAPSMATKIFNEIKTPGEYFDSDVFKMSEEEYLVDAGAYKGDSIDKLLTATKGKFGAIYSFELDNDIFQELEKTAEKYDLNKIKLFNAGVSDKCEEFEYGYVQGEEKHIAKVTPIDIALPSEKVTYIKMDVETYELKALEGAKRIIQTQKPKLCISAYHYLSDLWEVPLKIKALNAGYTVFLRHHSPAVWDTDCYAYVKE